MGSGAGARGGRGEGEGDGEGDGDGEGEGAGAEEGGVGAERGERGERGERTLAPKVLQALPRGRGLPSDAIADFCFPMGLEPKPISMQDSMSAVNSILFGAGQVGR